MGVRVNKRITSRRSGVLPHPGRDARWLYDTDHNFLHASSSRDALFAGQPLLESAFYQARRLPKEYNAQITMNSDTLHLAKNRR